MVIIEDQPFLDIKQLLHDEGIELGEGAGAQIGVGSHSRVFKAISNRGVVAVKLIDLRRRGEYIERFLERELKIIKQLHHPNIVRVFTVPKTKEFVAIAEEYAPNGDLLNYIRSRRDKRLEENEARILIRQLMEALTYLEGRFIVHRDIKCENMFLDAHFNLKLGDFGFTRELRPGEDSNTHCGSRPYAAIELLSGETYKGNAVDIWSAGVVLYVCLTGYFPFGGSDDDVLKIIERQKLRSINFQPHMSQPVRDLIRHMLHPQIPARATTKTVIRHKWLANTPYKMRTAGREPHG